MVVGKWKVERDMPLISPQVRGTLSAGGSEIPEVFVFRACRAPVGCWIVRLITKTAKQFRQADPEPRWRSYVADGEKRCPSAGPKDIAAS